MIVAEAVQSFELNIGLFDEIQELSDAGKLIPSLIREPEVELVEEEILVDLKEETIEIQVNSVEEEQPKKKHHHHNHNHNKSSAGKWIGAITIGVAAIAVGAAVYRRYYAKNK